MWTITLLITTVAEQMDNNPSQAGSVQVPNFEITKTAIAKFQEQTILGALEEGNIPCKRGRKITGSWK